MPEKFRFLLKGKEVDAENARNYEIIATGDVTEADTAYVFESQEAFNDWVKGTQYADRCARLQQLTGEARKQQGRDVSEARKRQKKTADRIKQDLEELSARTGLAYGSKELFLRATTESDLLEGPLFDPTILYDGINASGQSFISWGGFFPDLGWHNFDNRASSVQMVFDLATLYDLPWFQGVTTWLFGLLPFYQLNLSSLNFDNRTSSFVGGSLQFRLW